MQSYQMFRIWLFLTKPISGWHLTLNTHFSDVEYDENPLKLWKVFGTMMIWIVRSFVNIKNLWVERVKINAKLSNILKLTNFLNQTYFLVTVDVKHQFLWRRICWELFESMSSIWNDDDMDYEIIGHYQKSLD